MDEPYWKNAAGSIIEALVVYVLQGPGEKRNISEVRRLVAEGDVAGHATLPDAEKAKVTPFEVLFEKMKKAPDGPYRDMIMNRASTMLMMPGNQMRGVLMTAQEESSLVEQAWARYAKEAD